MTIRASSKFNVCLLLVSVFLNWGMLANAQGTNPSYRLPPLDIADIVDADSLARVREAKKAAKAKAK